MHNLYISSILIYGNMFDIYTCFGNIDIILIKTGAVPFNIPKFYPQLANVELFFTIFL